MCQLSVSIPDEVMYDRGLSVDDAQRLARRMTALGLYVSENVSLGYCSEVAGMHKEDFMRFLGTYGVSIFRYDDLSELEEDFANA
jgi:predicted HTH domain antitoxin